MTQTWNPAQTNSFITLSNGNLTATQVQPGTYAPGYGTEGFTTGKFYWETTVTGPDFVSSSSNGSVGVGNTSSSIANGQYLGIGTDTIGTYATGKIWNNNSASAATYGTYASGNVICHAYDVGGALYWYRVGTSGLWLNDVIGNQNPATGTGGFVVPAGVTAHPIVPAFNGFTNNPSSDVVVAAFASASWAGSAPAGFGPFDSTGTVLLPYVETWS